MDKLIVFSNFQNLLLGSCSWHLGIGTLGSTSCVTFTSERFAIACRVWLWGAAPKDKEDPAGCRGLALDRSRCEAARHPRSRSRERCRCGASGRAPSRRTALSRCPSCRYGPSGRRRGGSPLRCSAGRTGRRGSTLGCRVRARRAASRGGGGASLRCEDAKVGAGRRRRAVAFVASRECGRTSNTRRTPHGASEYSGEDSRVRVSSQSVGCAAECASQSTSICTQLGATSRRGGTRRRVRAGGASSRRRGSLAAPAAARRRPPAISGTPGGLAGASSGARRRQHRCLGDPLERAARLHKHDGGAQRRVVAPSPIPPESRTQCGFGPVGGAVVVVAPCSNSTVREHGAEQCAV